MLRQWIYKKFAQHYYPPYASPALDLIALGMENILGKTTVNYGGVKLTVGPYGRLDLWILRQDNINPYVTSALAQYLHAGGIFLDIGANHGVFSLLAARNPDVQVFAFEPSPRELTRLWKNLYLNNKPNISVLAYGLSDANKRQTFRLSPADNPGKNSLPSICQKGQLVNCQFTSLDMLFDDYIFQQIGVCKLDVEGQEFFILKSLASRIHLMKGYVFIIEMSPFYLEKANSTTKDIYDFFSAAGFIAQFGNPNDLPQWEEFFYHPDVSAPLILKYGLN